MILLLILPVLITTVHGGWNTEEMGMYDLMEEINQNFYELFGIAQDATAREVKKAYHRLSLEWHPDRNSAEDASEKFRQIAGIYEILKDKELREKYDYVLENGLPDWRQPIYYYRRVRKMDSTEIGILLSIILTVSHYFIMWGSYFEKYLNEPTRRIKAKKGEKAQKQQEEEERIKAILEQYKPTFWDILPFAIVRFTSQVIACIIEERKRQSEIIEEPEEAPRPRRVEVPYVPQEDIVYEVADIAPVVQERPEDMTDVSDLVEKEEGVWSGEEMAALTKLATQKFPPGTSQRWQHIAKAMNRTVDDVVAAARRIKHQTSTNELTALQSIKTAKEDKLMEWSQEEQRKFERALIEFPKGTPERWERIQEAVGTKSKAELVERFKHLAEMVKKKREQAGS